MKPIIVNMKDMSDSTEVYESRPNPFLTYFIYLLAALFIVAVGWMYFSKIDIVVKSNGMFRSEQESVDVSSSVSGVVVECNITEGQYVEEGDILFVIDAEALEATIDNEKELLEDVEQRIEMLQAYDRYLDGESNVLESYTENKYYNEFLNKKQLLELNTENTNADTNTQKNQYQKELDNVAQMIAQYEQQITKLRQAEDCVRSRNNNFSTSESYYESIVSSYISNYNVTAAQYDAQIASYQAQIEEYQRQIESVGQPVENRLENTEYMQQSTDVLSGTIEEVTVETEKTSAVSTDDLNQQIIGLQNNISTLSSEKEATLKNLELQQIAAIEQQIESVNASMNSAKSSRSSIQTQLEALNSVDSGKTEQLNVLTEKQNIAAELLTYEAQKKEYENTLKQYDLESGNATVTAANSGYIYLNQELKEGSYISQGINVCQILPENGSGFYAEIYVENADIAKIEEGQEVKFEIAAYPSSEYGYFTGVVDSISKDIKVDESSGSAYYLVKVRCEQTVVTNGDGKTGTLMNGMACQAKVVVDEEDVLTYLLKKIELLD